MYAFLLLLADKTILALIRASMKMRYSYGCLKECLNIIKTKTNWESETSKKHFEAGIRLMIGIFDITISFFPSRFIQFLEFVGFSANCKLGLDLLTSSLHARDSLRFPFVMLTLGSYHFIFEYLFGIGEPDRNVTKTMADMISVNLPNSFYCHLVCGLKDATESKFDSALLNLQKCLELPVLSAHIQKLVFFFLSLIKSTYSDWQEAAVYAKTLLEYKVSPALFTYLYASYLFMDYDLNGNKSLEPEIKSLLK